MDMYSELVYGSKVFMRENKNKLGLNWAKLSSNWNWALLQLRSVALNCSTKIEKVVTEYSLIANYREHEFPMPGCNLSSSTTPPLLH